MLSTKRKLLLCFLLVPIAHIILILWAWCDFKNRLDSKQPVAIGSLKHAGGSHVDIIGFIGDALAPQKYSANIQYDLVPISCVIDPIQISKGRITWESNFFLRTALRSTYSDKTTFSTAVNELITSMSKNKDFIKYFLEEPSGKYDANQEWLRTDNKAYIWDIPQTGQFYALARIRRMASLPIFRPSSVKNNVPLSEIHQRLKDNITIVVKRLFYQIADNDDPHLNAVVFAALAASTNQIDSEYYLSYEDSFITIHRALENSRIPLNIDRIYFVVYDGLTQISAIQHSIKGLFSLYMAKKHSNIPKWAGPLPWIILLAFGLWFTHPRRKHMLKDADRVEVLQRFLGYAVFLVTPLGVLLPTYYIWAAAKSVWLAVVGDIMLSLLCYGLVLWNSKTD